jgi:tRNA nucleotidyltransferase/poly(A) polymerase
METIKPGDEPRQTDDPLHPTENPYAGRWIAAIAGRIVAQGGTPDQACKAAQTIRFKDKPEVRYVATNKPFDYPEIFESIRALLKPDQPVYLVGGTVRDALMGKKAHDLDFCLPGDPRPLARQVAQDLGAALYILDDQRSTVRLVYQTPSGNQTGSPGNNRYFIDFAALRGPDLESDLRGRDFTINAMAVDVISPQQLLDPLGGAVDLRSGQLRACSPTAFIDDPLRIIRGIRLAADLSFHILPETRALMRETVSRLDHISAERKRDELFRILEGKQPETGIRALERLDALAYLLPELSHLKDVPQTPPHTQDVWNHTLATVQHLHQVIDLLTKPVEAEDPVNLSIAMESHRLGRFRRQFQDHLVTGLNPNRSLQGLISLAALYHDIAKPATMEVDAKGRIHNIGHEKLGAEVVAQRAKALQLSQVECSRLRLIVRHHMRIHQLVLTGQPPTRKAIFRFFRDTQEAGVDICILSLADTLATYGNTLKPETWQQYLDTCRLLLEAWWEKPEESISPAVLLNGHEIQELLFVPPSPRLGLLLAALREAQATGLVQNREQGLDFARQWLKEHTG